MDEQRVKQIDSSLEAQEQTLKFLDMTINIKLLKDLPPNQFYPEHVNYLLFITHPKFTDREFFYEVQAITAPSENYENIFWGDGKRMKESKFRSSRMKPLPQVDNDGFQMISFNYFFKLFERLKVKIHFNGQVTESDEILKQQVTGYI